MSRAVPPNPDEFEISIIGPGRGECVVVHLGDNEWCVIDSCRARGSDLPVAIEYLTILGNGSVDRVRLVVATHWHDDHIQGLSSILEKSPSAKFACSTAMAHDQFIMLVEAARSSIQGSSGVEEFAAIYGLIEKMGEAPKWAVQDRELLGLPGAGRSFPVTIKALSPSDRTVALALASIAARMPKVGSPQRRIQNVTPNESSVVLWIQAGQKRVLLGADLEHTNESALGWLGILSSHTDADPAFAFKVPHHGSENADCPKVWESMLIDNPFAVVTPFSLDLPGTSDLRRLAARTVNLFCTSVGPGKPPRRDPLVEKTAKYVATRRRVLQGNPGHVRIRWALNQVESSPTVELFNGARHVKAESI